MGKKLTLFINEDLIVKAKRYAAARKRSLSDVVEQYLRSLTQAQATKDEITEKVSALKGAIRTSSRPDYKKALAEQIRKKHG